MRSAPALVFFLFTAFVTSLSSLPQHSSDSPTARFLAAAPEPFGYRAWRRLEARNSRFRQFGWMEVTTTVGERGFEYQVLSEGGSERIRRQVLRAALDGERDVLTNISASALNATNYAFADDGTTEGLAKIRVTPLRQSRALIDGYLFVQPETADLVELRGRLVKMPSFWVRRADIVRKYERVSGVRVPVSIESVASVRVAGASTFSMRYVYEAINGHAVAR